ncbi:MAG: hypothetical protein Kow00121_45690 [Elainellaceae cyanobacterium]
MDDSWTLIRKVLGWANVVLEEVHEAMTNSRSSDADKSDVESTQQAIERLMTNKQQALQAAAAEVEYQELVRKLQAQNMPITPEEWERAKRLD